MGCFTRIAMEHQAVDEMLCVQNILIKRLKMAKGVNVVHLDNLLSFWRDFLEQEHMSWEEEVAFAVFRKMNHPLLDRLIGDHGRIKDCLANLEKTMKLLRTGRPHASREYAKLGEELVETVAEHLLRENSIFKELAAISGENVEMAEYPMPKGIYRKKLIRVFSVAEELCGEYLEKQTSLSGLLEEKDEDQEGEIDKKEIVIENSLDLIADSCEETILKAEETSNGQ